MHGRAAGGPGWKRSDQSSLGLSRGSWRAANLSPPRALGSVPPGPASGPPQILQQGGDRDQESRASRPAAGPTTQLPASGTHLAVDGRSRGTGGDGRPQPRNACMLGGRGGRAAHSRGPGALCAEFTERSTRRGQQGKVETGGFGRHFGEEPSHRVSRAEGGWAGWRVVLPGARPSGVTPSLAALQVLNSVLFEIGRASCRERVSSPV